MLDADVEAMLIGGTEVVVEVELLLTVWQLAVLEEAAGHRGISAGQLVRHLVGEFVGGIDDPKAAAAGLRLGEER